VLAAYDVPARASLTEIDEWMAARTDARGESAGLLDIRGVTFGIDGPPQFGLSLMNRPYRGPHGQTTSGFQSVALEKLTEIARMAVRHDLRLNIVAAGDKACTMVVDALSTVHDETPLSGRHWVLQHFFSPTVEQVATLKTMGIVLQTYTSIEFSRGEQVYVDRLGGETWQTVAPLRWWLDAGVPVALASDGGHTNPLFQIWTALRRVDGRTGRSLLTPAKTITRQEAITAYTMGGATAMGMADRIGSLEPGKLADFTIADRDVLTCPVDDLKDAGTVLTALGGRIRHDRR
jgi:predicted amidohydrolase YtcJ